MAQEPALSHIKRKECSDCTTFLDQHAKKMGNKDREAKRSLKFQMSKALKLIGLLSKTKTVEKPLNYI